MPSPSIRTLILALPALFVLTSASSAGTEPPSTGPPVGDVQALILPAQAEGTFLVPVMLGDDPRTLELSSYSVRGEAFRLTASNGVDAPRPVEAPATTVRGVIREEPGSLVAGSLVEGRLTAVLWRTEGEPVWGIQPASQFEPGTSAHDHLVYSGEDVVPGGLGLCGTVQLPADLPRAVQGTPAEGAFVKVCELAVDADFEYFTLNGSSVPQTDADIEALINIVSAVYEVELRIRIELVFVNVWVGEPDPYEPPTSGSGYLSAFRTWWNVNFPFVQRDAAHLFTGKNMSALTGYIGYAYIAQVCDVPSAYAWSQARYSSQITPRIRLISHELGHNFAATHCNSQPSCDIMCSIIGWCGGGEPSFEPVPTSQISNYVAGVACLDDGPMTAPPILVDTSPAEVQALDGGTVSVTGTGFATTTTLTVDGVDFSLWSNQFQIQSPGEASFPAPTPTHLGAVPITATNPGGTSNGVTFDYVETSPTKLVAYDFALVELPYTWTWGGRIGDLTTLLISFSPDTLMQGGLEILANPIAGIVSILPGPVGIDSYLRYIPAFLDNTDFWSQVLTHDENGDLRAATPVHRTCIGLGNPCL